MIQIRPILIQGMSGIGRYSCVALPRSRLACRCSTRSGQASSEQGKQHTSIARAPPRCGKEAARSCCDRGLFLLQWWKLVASCCSPWVVTEREKAIKMNRESLGRSTEDIVPVCLPTHKLSAVCA